MYILMVTLFILFILFVKLYVKEDARKMKTYEFRLSIWFHSTTTLTALALMVLHENQKLELKQETIWWAPGWNMFFPVSFSDERRYHSLVWVCVSVKS